MSGANLPGLAADGPCAELAASLGHRPCPLPPGSLVGLEHEFRVLRDGHPIDFRDCIHRLPIDGLRLDPGDTNAYRCRSGIAITADGAEAEFASPPVPVVPGFAREVAAWAGRGRRELEAALPPDTTLDGYSTHISVSMPDAINDAVAGLFARTFAAPLALLLERPGSLGIYVRPRPGRLELCGEFVDGHRLAAVVAFAVGSARACAAAIVGQPRGRLFPEELVVATLPGIERFGLRITREAHGVDLYAGGRATMLQTAAGAPISAQDQVNQAWAAARAALATDASPHDIETVDAMVAGRRPLGVELRAAEPRAATLGASPPSPFGRAANSVQRPRFTLSPLLATWAFTAFHAASAQGEAVLVVPRDRLAVLFARLDGGDLDALLPGLIERVPADRILASHEQTTAPGLYSGIAEPLALLATERQPQGREVQASSRPGKAAAAMRPGKAARPWKLLLPLPEQARSAPLPVESSADAPAPVSAAPGNSGESSSTQTSGSFRPRSWVRSKAAALAALAAVAVIAAGAAAAVLAGQGYAGGVKTPTPNPSLTAPATPTAAKAGGLDDMQTSPSPATSMPSSSATTSPAATPTALTATAAPALATAGTTPHPTDSVPTATPRSTPTLRPTETPRPTPSPTATATATAAATATATATAHATPTPAVGIPTLGPIPTIPPKTPAPSPAPVCTPPPGATCP